MKICIVGLGYMGLPTALLLAKGGYEVSGFDVVKKKIELLSGGKLPFEEKGLEELFAVAKKKFRATASIEAADTFIVAVPTPITSDKKCDLSYVEAAMRNVASVLQAGNMAILESTVRPGTTTDVVRPILEKGGLRAGRDFSLAYVSEKAIPGNTLHEMVHNDRIIGGFDDESRKRAKQLYSSFVKGTIHETDCTTAETVKLMENAYRDVNIALANELAKIGEEKGIDAWEAISLANHHPRVNIHQPGPGVGGHCIAIDPWFLIENGSDGVIKAARRLNDAMPEEVVKHIKARAKGKAVVALLGAAYKKNVDDARESPTERIAELCIEKGWTVRITDPFVREFQGGIVDFGTAVNGADIIVVVTDHDAYREKESLLKELEGKGASVLDTRNLFNGRFRTLGNGKHA